MQCAWPTHPERSLAERWGQGQDPAMEQHTSRDGSLDEMPSLHTRKLYPDAMYVFDFVADVLEEEAKDW